jgi:DNA-binding CsgD family transcriptional regulator/tetratricopeptide (TPR) repeat protein
MALLPLQWPLVGRHEELEVFTASLADPRAHGLVIYGPAGVGKTRLADQCLAIADEAGRRVARATATAGARNTPLGALAHLLPPDLGDERCDLVAVVAAVRPVLLADATNGPLVLFVDDLHALDQASAALIAQLVDADLVFLVATVRTSEPVPAGLESLWHRARVRRIDLGDLDRAAVDTLLHLVLRGPVEASAASEIWTASEGNVLFVRELVLGAIDGGRLGDQRGVWRLTGPLVATPRLHELVADRLGALDAEAQAALDILAMWEPTGLAVVESVVRRETLEALDRSGLLAVRADGRRQQVSLSHPLYGEVVRARMPALTRRRLLLDHADRIDAYGARRREDAIRVATARLEATGTADAALLLKAARLARYGHDFAQVERLGRAASVDGLTPEVGLLLGEALHELGRFEEAEDVLVATEAVTSEDHPLLIHIIEVHTRNLMWGLMRPDDALEHGRLALRRLEDHPAAAELVLNEAMLLTYSGRPLEIVSLLESVPPLVEPRARAMRAHAELPALVAIGRSVTAAEGALAAFAEQRQIPDEIALASPEVHMITRMYALAESGRLRDASELAANAYDATPPSAPPDAFIWLSQQRGRCALLMGQVDTARRWLAEAAARSDAHALSGPRRLVLSELAVAAAWAGDTSAAVAAAADVARLPPFAFSPSEQDLGPAWALAAQGDLPGARAALQAAADVARAAGYRGSEAWLLHDIARLGDPESVVDRLEELGELCEGELVPAYAMHAAAAAAGRGQTLLEAADVFEQLGAQLFAAEATAEAARAFRRQGDARAAAATAVRAATLVEGCEGARTPALAIPMAVSPLTARERDIATLAAQGMASKEIADHLFLSVRTVNNHLQSVYSKLGVGGRRELAAVLAEVSESVPRRAPAERPASSSPP